MSKTKWYRCYLVNIKVLGQGCGFGLGKTIEEAQADALRKAREIDPNAYLEGGQVYFDGGPVHL